MRRFRASLWLLPFLAGLVNCASPATYEVTPDNLGICRSGIPLGGIGAGTVEIRADGKFHEWQIFNNWCAPKGPEVALFAVYARPEGKASVARALQISPPRGLPGVPKNRFTGEFPFATVRPVDPSLPVEVELEAFTPLIPHDAKNSALPAAIFKVRVKNRSLAPCEVSLLSCLQSGCGIPDGCPGGVTSPFEAPGLRGALIYPIAGEPPRLSRRVKVLCVADTDRRRGDVEAASRPLRPFRNLELHWTRFDGRRVVLPTYEPREIVKRFDVIWLNEVWRMRDTLGEDGMRAIAEAVRMGCPLFVNGGWDSFYGHDPGRWAKINGTLLEEVMPVRIKRTWDSVDRATTGRVVNPAHPALQMAGIREFPRIGGYNVFAGLKPGAKVIIETADGKPLLIEGRYGKGRVMVYASSTWGYWPPYWWPKWPQFVAGLIAYLAGARLSPPTGLPPNASSFGTMVVCSTSPKALATGWDDLGALWKDFSKDGRLERRTAHGLGKPLGGAVCVPLRLGPGEEGEAAFLWTWHFPNHYDRMKTNIGHMYCNWFRDALDVAKYVAKGLRDLERRTREFHDALYNSTLPYWLADAISAQMSTLTKSTWWDRSGNFGVWEGMNCCCGLSTTDVGHYGSWMVLLLFPELEKNQLLRLGKFQAKDGWIPHLFPGTFSRIDGYWRVDMNEQWVLMALRDYLWTGDREFFERAWPTFKRAVEWGFTKDEDGDGIVNIHGSALTYDGWPHEGTSVYIASLWLSALKAAERAATEMGDKEFARRCREAFRKAQKSTVDELWDSKWGYFILWHDIRSGRKDEGLMLDGMNGQWYAHLLGLGYILDPEKVRSHLRNAFRYNRVHVRKGMAYMVGDYGYCYVNGYWPKGPGLKVGHQWGSPWTGTEYAFASHLILEGMVEEGLQVARDVYERYKVAGMTWNHIECGTHYYRPMVVITVLLALLGERYDATKGLLEFSPRLKAPEIRAPFILPSGWGIYERRLEEGGQKVVLSVKEGKVEFSRLLLSSPKAPREVSASLNRKALKVSARFEDGKVALSLPSLSLGRGDVLSVSLKW